MVLSAFDMTARSRRKRILSTRWQVDSDFVGLPVSAY
jgi:hypothetical protein